MGQVIEHRFAILRYVMIRRLRPISCGELNSREAGFFRFRATSTLRMKVVQVGGSKWWRKLAISTGSVTAAKIGREGVAGKQVVAIGDSRSLRILRCDFAHILPIGCVDVWFLAKGRGSPGLSIYVVMTAGAAVGSTGTLRRRMAAEMRVMIRPTGRGSMKV